MRKLCLLAWSLTALAQTPVFKTDTTLQSIAVQVTDKRGKPVRGLTASDFTLLEDGKPQEIAFFGAEKQPSSLAVLIDSSSSMRLGGKFDRARALLSPLLRGSTPDDEIFLVPFTDRLLPPDGIAPFTPLNPDQRRHPPAVKPGGSGDGGTAIYDALASTLCHMRTAQNVRQAVVVVTDGADQNSRLNLEQLIHLTRSSNARIFLIGFFAKSEYESYRKSGKTITLMGEREIDNPRFVFESLASESGAESFFPTSESELQKALATISDILEAQYTLAYYPRDPAHFRRVEVKVKDSGMRVLSRRAVGADANEGEVHFMASSCEVYAKDHPYPWEQRITRDANGLLTYHEDFSDTATGWPNRWREGFRYLPGGYEISRESPSNIPVKGHSFDGVVTAYGPPWENFRASVVVEAKLEANKAGRFAMAPGLIFHLGPDGYYALVVSGKGFDAFNGWATTHDIAVELVKRTWQPGAETIILPWTKVDATTMPLFDEAGTDERKRKLTVEYIGGHIHILVNDREVSPNIPDIRDTTYPKGYIGLALFGSGDAVFHDLIVRDIP